MSPAISRNGAESVAAILFALGRVAEVGYLLRLATVFNRAERKDARHTHVECRIDINGVFLAHRVAEDFADEIVHGKEVAAAVAGALRTLNYKLGPVSGMLSPTQLRSPSM